MFNYVWHQCLTTSRGKAQKNKKNKVKNKKIKK